MSGNEFYGRVIGVTRPAERASEAVHIIEEHGGTAILAPTLELQISNSQELVDMCKMAEELDWLIFTSPTAIISLFKHCKNLKDRLSSDCRVAVIGPRTEKFLAEHGLEANLVPDDYTAEGLLDSFKGLDLHNKNIGIPKTMAARETLPEGLIKMGANVIVAEAYRSGLPENKDNVNTLINGIIARKVDAVTFTSTLTVQNLFKMAEGKRKEELINALRNGDVVTVAIGPVTAKPLIEEKIPVLIPGEYTVKAMLELLMGKFNSN